MKKVLKVLGWLIVPYLMLLVFWKKTNKLGRIVGIIYTVIIVISAIVNGNNDSNTDKAATQTVATSSSTAASQPATTDTNKVETAKTDAQTKADQEAVAKKKADDEAAAAQKKADEEAAAKKAAEEKAKQIQPGTYQIGTDIQPGLYKTDDGIAYWARLKGLSGDLGDILANGNPVGSAIVEILPTDKAFQTQGSGYWYKIDDTYNPTMQTSIGDGTYIVGKDIAPGTYKSEGGSLGYWARLSGFTGDLNQVLANANPQGPTIVEIKATDKGFQTFGNGTWTKVQ